MDKYQKLLELILENFETATNEKDRLHTQDLLNILSDNVLLFSASKTKQVFKSMNTGKRQCNCIINKIKKEDCVI